MATKKTTTAAKTTAAKKTTTKKTTTAKKTTTKKATTAKKTTAKKTTAKKTTAKKTTSASAKKANKALDKLNKMEVTLTIEELNRMVEHRAYDLFMERGYSHGDDMNDWLRAEQEIRSKYAVK